MALLDYDTSNDGKVITSLYTEIGTKNTRFTFNVYVDRRTNILQFSTIIQNGLTDFTPDKIEQLRKETEKQINVNLKYNEDLANEARTLVAGLKQNYAEATTAEQKNQIQGQIVDLEKELEKYIGRSNILKDSLSYTTPSRFTNIVSELYTTEVRYAERYATPVDPAPPASASATDTANVTPTVTSPNAFPNTTVVATANATPQTATTQLDETNKLKGEADEDNSSKADAGKNQITPGAENEVGSAQVDGQGNRVSTSEDLPGRRLFNPLSKFASYTYQITLYMITPDAYDAFVSSGRRNINILNNASNTGAGAYIIAQSAGINNTTTQRAPGFGLDLYIDDLLLEQAINGQASQTSTNITNIKFSILEPYGFSFISNLRRSADALKEYSKNLGNRKAQNPARQLYILAIRFNGYDINGNVVSELKNYDGSVNSSQDGFFETFYDIFITGIKFKLDGKAIKYSIEARAAPPQAAFGTKRGILNNTSPIQASTVKDALIGVTGLLTRMNKEQEDMLASGKISEKNTFSVEFIGDSAKLENATIVSPADLSKYRWAGSGTQNSSQVNDASATSTVPNPTQRQITFAAGTTVMNAIQQIVTQSSYLEDALKVVYTTELQPDATKKDSAITQNSSEVPVRWYNLSAKISNAKFDDKIGDFAYDILYIMQPYETPVIRNAYSKAGVKYYGPHKRYKYWYTGQNSEILKYEHSLDCLYYNAVLGNPNIKSFEDAEKLGDTDTGKGGAGDVPLVPGQRQPQSRLGRLNTGMEAQNAYLTDLYDPAGLASCKVTILGDPDYLVQEQASSLDAAYSQFYGTNGYTINPNGGQVFFEIDFKEGVDYNHSSGLMDINEQIRFWKYPQEIEKLVEGVVYKLVTLKHNFTRGVFTQELQGYIETFPGAKEETGTGREPERGDTAAAPPTPDGTATTASTGQRQDPPLPVPDIVVGSTQPVTVNALPTDQSVATSADDDGGNAPPSATTGKVDTAVAVDQPPPPPLVARRLTAAVTSSLRFGATFRMILNQNQAVSITITDSNGFRVLDQIRGDAVGGQNQESARLSFLQILEPITKTLQEEIKVGKFFLEARKKEYQAATTAQEKNQLAEAIKTREQDIQKNTASLQAIQQSLPYLQKEKYDADLSSLVNDLNSLG